MNNIDQQRSATGGKQYSPRSARGGPSGHHYPGPPMWRPVQPAPGLQQVGTSGDGFIVFDRPNSHHHVSPALLTEALGRFILRGQQFAKERVDFGRVIGNSDCVSTGDADEIVFARRPGRAGLTRFVIGRPAEACASMIIILKRREDEPNSYVLITAFAGTAAEPEPWDKNASPTSREFWSSHALIHGSCPILPETQTRVCSW